MDNTQVKLLRAATDRIGGHLVYYYVGGYDGKIHKFEPLKAREVVRKRMDGILDTIRCIKGDPVAEPAEEIFHADGTSEAFFCGELLKEDLERMAEDYLKDLPEEYERLEKVVDRLEQLELAHEAGILSSDGKEFNELLAEFSKDLRIW